MSILVIESFERAADGRFDLSPGAEGGYAHAETAAAFWAWAKAREGVVISLPEPYEAAEWGPEPDLFTREQVQEMASAAGITLR